MTKSLSHNLRVSNSAHILLRRAMAAALVLFAATVAAADTPRSQVRLVLQITVDQLRPDIALRVRDRWSRGGLRFLYDRGAVFADAHHRHANTETVVGHATLATGADPSVHGLVGNAWFDRDSGAVRYNFEDAAHPLVGRGGAMREVAGHPQVAERTTGRSPAALLVPTLADSIAKAGKGRAHVYSVSLKDRSAIAMGGYSARTFWWSEASGEFVSSTWYFRDASLPRWAREWNESHGTERIDGRTWDLMHPRQTYLAADRDDMPWEEPPEGMGRTFPHVFSREALGAAFHTAVVSSPFGDELLLDFTRELLRTVDFGEDEVVDYLSVAFSSLDLVGHRFGPSSLEYEDALLRLDDAIGRLLRTVEEEVGTRHVLVVLSSDHGVVEPPEELLAAGREAGELSLFRACSSPVIARLASKAGCEIVRRTWPPYVYLETVALARHRIDVEHTARILAAEVANRPGVEAVFTRGQIEAVGDGADAVALAVRRSFHRSRSGDLHVVVRPGWQFLYEGTNAARFATSHGTPWRYDTHVPLVLVGPGVPRTAVDRRVETVDVAATVAALAGVPAPAGTTGRVLGEAIAAR